MRSEPTTNAATRAILEPPAPGRYRPWVVRGLAVAALLAGLSGPQAEAQLRRGRQLDSLRKSCIDCHSEEVQEYERRASKHEPVRKEQCESCHRRHGVVGILRLQAEDPALCLSCHTAEGHARLESAAGEAAPVEVAPAMSFSHPPAQVMRCGACHEPHGSDQPHLLKEAGSQACLSCHEASSFQGTSAHTAAQADCLTCHNPHGSELVAGLRKRAEELCVSCHSGSSEAELAGHGSRTMAPASCLGCHGPHASQSPGLLRAHVHAPMAEGSESCAICHTAGADAQEFALSEAVPGLCLNCHEDPRIPAGGENPAQPVRVHAAVEEGDCLLCHSPHASDQAALLRQPQQKICGECHEQPDRIVHAKFVHEPARSECTACHSPHVGGDKLLARSVPSLCETCHADIEEQLARTQPHPPAAEGECLQCHDPHAAENRGLLSEFPIALCSTCHSEIEQELAQRDTHPPAVAGECAACHEPHGSEQAHLVRADLAGACLKCHVDKAQLRAQGETHAPFEAGECLSCHRPHASSKLKLLKTEPTLLCRTCHDELPGEANASSRHAPVARGQCLDCHEPHGGGSGPPFLRLTDTRVLCVSCHEEQATLAIRRDLVVHPPFKSEPCLTCHVAHASVRKNLLADEPASLCGTCHNVEGPELNMAHQGLLSARADCTGCHEPHASPARSLILPVQHLPFAEGQCDRCHDGGRP